MAKRTDANQSAIVAALRRAGCSVAHTYEIGRGFPDLAVGRAGLTYLLEVKSPGGTLTPDEVCFRACWRGQLAVVDSVEAALAAVGLTVFAGGRDG